MTAGSLLPRGGSRIVDAHLHVWDLDRAGYSWLNPRNGVLHATIGPDRAARELEAAHVGCAVLVQADDSDADTDFLLEVAADQPWVGAVVGWLPLDRPGDAAPRLEHLSRDRVFRGIRYLSHDDPRDHFYSLPGVRESLRRVYAAGLTLDVPNAWPRHLEEVSRLAAAIPALTIVLDHLGKPPADLTHLRQWRAQLERVAVHDNTVAKVSGLHHLSGQAVRFVWETALELFGPQRLLWGSDWPMTLAGEGYLGTASRIGALIAELESAERVALLHGTAERIYQLPRSF